jgi:hypothetical protein
MELELKTIEMKKKGSNAQALVAPRWPRPFNFFFFM